MSLARTGDAIREERNIETLEEVLDGRRDCSNQPLCAASIP